MNLEKKKKTELHTIPIAPYADLGPREKGGKVPSRLKP
jgi:hypothetical protein